MFQMLNPCRRISFLSLLLTVSSSLVETAVHGQSCPLAATGSCIVSHPTPGCADPVCCELVCAIDPSCCTLSWDANCVLGASFVCTIAPPQPCGLPASGPCNQVHTTPSCADAACCESVCSIYPLCCSTAWDQICVSAAIAICQTSCSPACPPQSTAENEPCQTVGPGNSPCIDGASNTTLLTMQNSKSVCGSFRTIVNGTDPAPDIDAYRLVLPDPDGDGLSRLSLSFQSEFNTIESGTTPSFVALLSDPCLPLSQATLFLQTNGCGLVERVGCLPAGTWFLVAARGTFPSPQALLEPCPALQSYNIRATWDDQCASDPCGSSGDCFVKHATAGCQDAACCASVCQIDPVCCQKSWDEVCVSQAVSICGPSVPPNDDCGQATALALGATPFTLIGATPSGAQVPAACVPLGTTVGGDVWFQLRDIRGYITVRTCAAQTLNTAIMVYAAPCSAASVAIACNDNSKFCFANPLSAEVAFTATCAVDYLVRVASIDGSIGAGTLTVTSNQPLCPGCAADLNHDQQVDGTDLTTILSGWGSAGSGDIDGNGIVDGADLTTALSGWGPCP